MNGQTQMGILVFLWLITTVCLLIVSTVRHRQQEIEMQQFRAKAQELYILLDQCEPSIRRIHSVAVFLDEYTRQVDNQVSTPSWGD